ncbi:MAG: transcriptional repressor LexA [candidate division WOR-3 bacterium]|nr:MAG: transcriptional repressor LexA [candidate division WOR-3 bacterium]
MFTRDKDRRQKIVDFIRQYTEEHGFPPSVREIGRAVGIRSTRAVKYHLDILVQQGTLERTANKARSVTTGSSAYALPLVGRIAAGSPVLAVENIESQISLSRFRDCFLLRVHGDSMTGAGIIDGDMVIVRQQSGARNGEIVAAMIGDEATVKRFERRKDRVTLYPENPDFKPIVIRKDQGEFHIIGVVVGLLRNYR